MNILLLICILFQQEFHRFAGIIIFFHKIHSFLVIGANKTYYLGIKNSSFPVEDGTKENPFSIFTDFIKLVSNQQENYTLFIMKNNQNYTYVGDGSIPNIAIFSSL